MKKILLGTNSIDKIMEFKEALKYLDLEMLTLKEIGVELDIEENGKTFEENARKKAIVFAKKTKLPVLVDDSGLCIDFLNEKPGVYSKRFLSGSDKDRNEKILSLLENVSEQKRTARYICSLVFMDLENKIEKKTLGICEGKIDFKQKGNNGFGYDPLFIPEGFKQSFGELDEKIKAEISHRGKAIAQMVPFLKEWIMRN